MMLKRWLYPLLAVILIVSGGLYFDFTRLKVSAQSGAISFDVGAGSGETLAVIQDKARPYLNPQVSQNGGEYTFAFNGYASAKIGTQGSFSQQMRFLQWDANHWIQLSAGGMGTLNNPTVNADNSLTAGNNSFTVTWKPTGVVAGFNEIGGLDYIVSILRKTSIAQVAFSYSAMNVVGYLQPALDTQYLVGQVLPDGRVVISVTQTDVIITGGAVYAHTPDYVVNSIAFYATNAGGVVSPQQAAMYLTSGKVGSLYRMKVTGKNGTWAWMDWQITANTITLRDTTGYIAAQASANYPLTITPAGDTFGYTTAGGSGVSVDVGYIYGAGDTYAGAAGTGTSLSVSIGGTSNCCLAVYDTASPKNLVGYTDSTAFNHNQAWETINFNTNPTLSAVNYYLFFQAQGGTIYYDSGASGVYYTQSYGSFPSTMTTWTYGTKKLSLYCTYTASGGTADMTNTGGNLGFGVVAASSTYYAKGSAPSNPVADGECTWYITNTASAAEDYTIKCANWTGGTGWTVSSSTGADTIKMTAYYSGQNPASGLVLSTSAQSFYSNLAASAHIHWDLKLETGTFTDGAQKTGVITIVASLH